MYTHCVYYNIYLLFNKKILSDKNSFCVKRNSSSNREEARRGTEIHAKKFSIGKRWSKCVLQNTKI